jgi:carboxyl-terminal processing protease
MMNRISPALRRHWSAAASIAAAMVAAAGLNACGGGGGGTPPPSPPPPSGFEPSSTYAGQCVSPRPAGAIDPFTNTPYGDVRGTATSEKNWVRSWIDETYLWYAEVPNASAASYPNALSYFDILKTSATTASGAPKDRFHFTYGTPEWVALSQSGVELGYGIEYASFSVSPPRRFVVAYTEPSAAATTAGVRRGDELVSVDGVDFVNGSDVDTLNAALFPSSSSTTHTFEFRPAAGGSARTVTLRPADIARTPVPNVATIATPTGTVGYLLFNDHIATAESQLIDAINGLKAAGPISDLVLDIRYNGGGYLAIASELAYMIAGPTRTADKAFETLRFNDKNPFDFSAADAVTPFYTRSQGFSGASGSALPQLGLARVYVLTGEGTCSASEAIINGLRGVDVDVRQIGETTCGKPYGFYPTDNCSTTYFAIQFEGVNNKGFGSYSDGFVPGGAAGNGVPGCSVADDFTHPLGDAAEGRLAAALSYRETGTCPAAGSKAAPLSARPSASAKMLRTPLRENRIYRPR